jgi:CBS domain-containing protein
MGVLSTIMGFGAGYVVGATKGFEPVRRARDGVVRKALRRGLPSDVQIREVMTAMPQTVTLGSTLTEAARLMAADDIGDVIVTDQGSGAVVGIVTDRDIAIRAVAEERDLRLTSVGDIFSHDLVAVGPTDDVGRALEIMEGLHVRRLPVVEGGRPIGVVSLGDLAVERNVGSTLARISAAAPDR